MRNLLTPLAATTAALTLVACGGGESPATVPPVAPAPNAAMHQQAVTLAEAVFALADTAMGPIFYGTDDAVVVLASSAICGGGSADTRLNGAAVSAGTQLPVGNHTFDTTFSACRVASGVTLTGATTVAYSAPTSILTGVTANGSASGVRWQGVVTPVALRATARRGSKGGEAAPVKALGTAIAVDYTGSGGLVFAFNESVAGGIRTLDNLLRPATGATLLNNATRNTLTFVSGAVREVATDNVSAGTFFTYSLSFDALTFNVGTTPVEIDGTLTRNFIINSTTTGGQAALRVAGTQVGTLRFATDGRLVATLTADVPAW